MKEHRICCCGARTWTLIIGWLELIGNILALISTRASWKVLAANPSQFGYFSQAEREVYERGLTRIMIITAIQIVLFIFMDIILLHGTYKKNR
ncbi:unnamed protein product, partial [Allacma fusca]